MIDPHAVAQIAAAYTAAWNSGSAAAVAAFYAENGRIAINRGQPWIGRSAVQDMAAAFFADVPDLTLTCDDLRCAGTHVVYVWTFTGHDAKTRNPLTIRGWEEWELDADLNVASSLGWYDVAEYARQAGGPAS